ncbi:MAG: hypothetical protein EXR79_03945, partial [Myxococcales bacterium]|nr:hypothetical protein [Myxococcales bacterium]
MRAALFATITFAVGALGACGADPVKPAAGGAVEPDTANAADVVLDDADAGPSAKDAPKGQDLGADAKADCTTDEDCKALAGPNCKRATCDLSLAKPVCVLVGTDAGAKCDDNKECTTADVCDAAGACSGKVTCEDGKPCTTDACDDDGKCLNSNNKNVCDDGNACTTGDVCDKGACIASKVIKDEQCPDDGNACTDATCDAKTGCAHLARADGSLCSDGDQCTEAEKCKTGKCAGGIPVTCKDDGNPCTAEKCDSKFGCEKLPAKQGEPCNDGASCTIDDICVNAKCTGKPHGALTTGNPCMDAVPVPNTPTCTVTLVPKLSGICDDGVGCTKQDQCKQGKCEGAKLVCNDGNPCTDDACDEKKCIVGTDCGYCAVTPKPDGTVCDDGDKCTSADACGLDPKTKVQACAGKKWESTGQCEDKNGCTNDSCQPAIGCLHVPTDGKFCDDGDPCTIPDTCLGSACKGKKKDCADSLPCTADACDVKTGACTHAKQEAVPCEDGNKCTEKDFCSGGICDGQAIVCNDQNPCTNDFCSTQFGCQKLPLAGGAKCDDGLSCTSDDYCDAGKCVAVTNSCVGCKSDLECATYDDGNICNGLVRCIPGPKAAVCAVDLKTVVTCDASQDSECSKNTCDAASGKCAVVLKPEAAPCAANNKCLQNASCTKDGSCVGIAVKCEDNEPCTTDVCDSKKGCLGKPLPDNELCNDNNACTPNDKCNGGKCIGDENTCKCKTDGECLSYDDGNLCNGTFKCIGKGAGLFVCEKAAKTEVTCPPDKNEPCLDQVCSAVSGKCEGKPKLNAAPCDDGNACSAADSCVQGKCTSDKKVNCDDDNKCTADICDKVFGCDHAALATGALCNDGNACTAKDTCLQQVCTGILVKCDDGNPCTIDVCNKAKGGCSVVLDDNLTCDDGDPCSTKDACKDGTCKGSVLDCNDGNSCSIDNCDGKGGCKNVVIENKDCQDGDACTTGDTCIGGKCIGKAKNCDDNNPCTEESCSKGTCAVLAGTGKACDDGNACTEADKCSGTGACVGGPVQCKADGVCGVVVQCSPTKGCVIAANDGVSCNDNDACTGSDKCAGGGCQGITIDCDDKNLCTLDGCDPKKGCQIKQNTCNDKNDCTFDKCDQQKGCVYEAIDGAACDDGDPCTEKGKCAVDKCKSVPKPCDDKNSCTVDSC